MLILIVINIIIILWIYLKYYDFAENKNTEKINNDKIYQMDPMIMGYINDKKFDNSIDFILAEIINLNIKGYIKIEYDINSCNYVIKPSFDINSKEISKHEIILLEFLFLRKTEITKTELEEKLINTFNLYNVQYNDLQKVIQEELIKENILDKEKNEELKKISKIYQIISMLSMIIVLITKLFINTEISSLEILIYILEKIISNILVIKASNYTPKGRKLQNDIIAYKKTIENKEFLIDKKTINQIILEKEFANSLALHINTQAKKEFLDDKISKNAIKNVKTIAIKLIILSVIVFVIGLILGKITKSMTKDQIVWLYTMLAIIIAFAADITKILGTIQNKKN